MSFRAQALESSRKAHFAPLDCHVATFVAPRNDKGESSLTAQSAISLAQGANITVAYGNNIAARSAISFLDVIPSASVGIKL